MPKISEGTVTLTAEEFMSRIVRGGATYNSLEDCHPDPYNPRCRYNGLGEDFEKCSAWQFISRFSERARELGKEQKKILDEGRARNGMQRIDWDPHDRLLCPVIEYGSKKGAAYVLGAHEFVIPFPGRIEEG